MSMQTQILVPYDGVRNVTVQLTGIADGLDQETNVLKVDLAALAYSYQAKASSVKIRKIQWNISGAGSIILSWENATAPVPFATLDGQGGGPFKYHNIDGLPNLADAPTGNILLTTVGFEPGSNYTVELEMVKKYAN